jgi:hypothetical protein
MASIRIENRAQLVYLLTEAAELEHMIMCCYLYTNFTLKDSTSEGVTEEQLASIRRWRGLIREVAVQEMLHLACVCNLLTAVGAAPQLRRPNLPASPAAYGATFKLQLLPFNPDTIDQFVKIEMPESLQPRETALPERPLGVAGLSEAFSTERAYTTQGHLYHGIEDGLKYLVQKLGEERVFIGPPGAQTAERYFEIPGLTAVTDLRSAMEAIRIIVEQGEGAAIESPDSHYAKFSRIQREYQAELARDPAFVPGRPALANPYVKAPMDLAASGDITLVTDPLTVDVSSLFDGCYEFMVQMLGRLFVHAEESEAELQDMAAATLGIMVRVIEPLGSALTLMPAGREHPGRTAGPSFRLSRGATIPTHKEAARVLFNERLTELANYCRLLQAERRAPAVLADVRNALTELAATFA